MSRSIITDRRYYSAFTLIELLVVIIIITVVAGVLVPTYGHLNARMRFDGMVADVQDLFDYAREQAIARDTSVTVSYDPQSAVFVASMTPLPPSADMPVVMAEEMNGQSQTGEITRVVPLNSDYAVQNFHIGSNNTGSMRGGGSRTLQFRGDGTCEGAELTLISRDGYAADLVVLPANGHLVRADDAGGRLTR